MTRTIDIPTFQTTVVRNCSPTLAGIKPASLFTYPGPYANQNEQPGNPHIEARRTRLLAVIAQCNRELEPLGKGCGQVANVVAFGGKSCCGSRVG